MATPNVGILTTAGKALIDKVNSGQAKISFSKVVFSSMDNSQLSDTQIKALTAITPQEVVVSSPQTTLDTNSGETRIRATGTNEKLADGVYVKTYGVFAKDDTGSEILYGVTVSPNPNYFPAYDGVTPQAVTYSYKTVIQETSNITMTNSNDVYVTQEDLTEALATIPQPDLSGYDRTDDVDKKLQNKQDKLDYTPADDSKVSHLSGANNFDTVPMVNHNPLLLASSLPSDLARTGSNQEFTGKNTFDTAPIDKTTGNPYITKDSVPAVPSTLADTTKPANFTAGLQSGGVDVATAADLKSVENSAWRPVTSDGYDGIALIKYDPSRGVASLSGTIFPLSAEFYIPLPEDLSMGKNSDYTIFSLERLDYSNGPVFDKIQVILEFTENGIKVKYSNYQDDIGNALNLNGFYGSNQNNGFIEFKATKN